jgi:hypothetical protein
LEVGKSCCCKDFKPHTQTISTHYNLNEKIEFQSKNDVHEIFHFSHLDFDYTHDSSHEEPIDQCKADNGTFTKSEATSD